MIPVRCGKGTKRPEHQEPGVNGTPSCGLPTTFVKCLHFPNWTKFTLMLLQGINTEMHEQSLALNKACPLALGFGATLVWGTLSLGTMDRVWEVEEAQL